MNKLLCVNAFNRLTYHVHAVQALTVFLLLVSDFFGLISNDMARVAVMVRLELDSQFCLFLFDPQVRDSFFKEGFGILTREKPITSRFVSLAKCSFAIAVTGTSAKCTQQPIDNEKISVSNFYTQTVRWCAKFTFSTFFSGKAYRNANTSLTIYQSSSIRQNGNRVVYLWNIVDGEFFTSRPFPLGSMKTIDVLTVDFFALNNFLLDCRILKNAHRIRDIVCLELNCNICLMVFDFEIRQNPFKKLLCMIGMNRPLPCRSPFRFSHAWLPNTTFCITAKSGMQPFYACLVSATHTNTQTIRVADITGREYFVDGDTSLPIDEASRISQRFNGILSYAATPFSVSAFLCIPSMLAGLHHSETDCVALQLRAYPLADGEGSVLRQILSLVVLYSCVHYIAKLAACQV